MKLFDKQSLALLVSVVTINVLCIIAVSYAYFTTQIKGNEDSTPIEVVMGSMKIKYEDSDLVTLDNAIPGDYLINKFKITNTGTLDATYNLKIDVVENNFRDKGDLEYTLRRNNEVVDSGVLPYTDGYILTNVTIPSEEIHNYELEVKFKEDEIDKDQNDNKNRRVDFKIVVDSNEDAEEYVYKPLYKDNSGANMPELYQGLIPVTIDNDGTIKYADITEKWYDYTEHEWANAVLLENNKIKDKSNNHVNATYVGATIKNGEATLDGKDDYIDCGYANYDFGSAFSTIIRFKLNSLKNDSVIIANTDSAGFAIILKKTGVFQYSLHNGTEYKIYNSTKTLDINKWYEVALTFNGTEIKTYINGELQENDTYKLDTITKMKPSLTPLYLGADPNFNGQPTLYSDANITKALVYDRTLSNEEISKIYQNQEVDNNELLLDLDFKSTTGDAYNVGDTINMSDISQMYTWIPRYKYQLWNAALPTIKDKSSNKADATYFGAKVENGEATLDGVDDYINCGYDNYDFGNEFSAIVKFKLNGSPTDIDYILGNAEAAGIILQIHPEGVLGANIHDGNGYKEKKDSTILDINRWYEVGMVFDGNTIKLYINGSLQENSTYKFDSEVKIKQSSMPFYLGANPSPGDPSQLSNITFSKAMVYHRVLTENEISKIYNDEEIEDKDNGLLFDLDFNEVTPTVENNEQMINVEFEKNDYSTGTATCTIDNKGKETCVNANNGEWYTHPAFTFGDTDLYGIWVGKFETGGSQDNLTIKPNISSQRGINVSNMFNRARNTDISFSGRYNLNSNEIDTHMMKNSEWGAVAYLAQSKYGRFYSDGNEVSGGAEVWANANKDHITGCGGNSAYGGTTDICIDWLSENGKHASTTDNQYGIYDMAGGTWENTMGAMSNLDGSNIILGSSGFENEKAINSKYYDLYQYNMQGIYYSKGHLGDSTKEVLKLLGSGWYNDYVRIPYTNSSNSGNPWFSRGGAEGAIANDGIFASNWSSGSGSSSVTFRVVLTAQDGVD